MGKKTSLTIKILLASLFTMLLVVFVFTDNYSLGQSDSGDVAADALVGTAEGHNGPLSVAVTMDGDTITDVTVTDHVESEGISDPAIADVPGAIVDANSTDVDTVSGATVTSEAIMAAVEDALAGGTAEVVGETYTVEVEGHNGPMTVDVTLDGATITDVTVTEHSETEGLADPALADVPVAIVAANSTDVEVVSGATVTSEAIIAAVEQVLADGNEDAAVEGDTHSVEVEGHNGPMTVDVTLDGDTILAVEVTDHGETEGLADPALADVPAAIVEANSTDVEVVSGATVTSEAIIEAVSQVLAE